MKKFLIFLLTGTLVLGACNNDNSSDKESNNKSDNKTEKNLIIIHRRIIQKTKQVQIITPLQITQTKKIM